LNHPPRAETLKGQTFCYFFIKSKTKLEQEVVVLVEINGKITVIIVFIVVILHPDFENRE
jgi:hypothetical protein